MISGTGNTTGFVAFNTRDDIASGVHLDNSTITGDFVNGGTISGALTASSMQTGNFLATAYGVYVANGGTIGGALSNAGTISAVVGGVNQNGRTEVSADAIDFNNSTLTGTLTNTEVITASTSYLGGSDTSSANYADYANGIQVEHAGTVGGVTNAATGTISVSATAEVTAGRVYASANGVVVTNGTITGTLLNQGTITATTHVVNSGSTNTAYASAYGITLETGTIGAISNTGTITAMMTDEAANSSAGGEAYGMYFRGTVGSVTNASTGVITATAHSTQNGGRGDDASAYGIFASNAATITGSLLNQGHITATATEDGEANSAGARSYGMGAGFSTVGDITNDTGGVIMSHATASNIASSEAAIATAYGIYAGSTTVTNGILNKGTIVATANASASTATATAYGIYVRSGSPNSVTNQGVITATAEGSAGALSDRAIGIYISGTGLTSFTNSGTITAVADASAARRQVAQAYGVQVIDGTQMTGAFTNSGTITTTATGTNSAVSDSIDVENSRIDGGIINTTTGVVNANGGTAINLVGLTGSTPITINGGHIIGDIDDANSSNGYSPTTIGGDFSTEGNFDVSSLTVSSGKTFVISPGNTVTLYTMPASTGGTFAFGVNSAIDHAFLTVTNGPVNLTGATVREDGVASGIHSGDVFRVATGTSAITGGPGATPTHIGDTSYLWDFQDVDGTGAPGIVGGSADDLYFIAVQGTSLADAADNQNNRNVSAVLQGDDLANTSDPTILQIQGNLNNAPTRKSYNDTLESTEPTTDNGAPTAAIDFSGQVFDVADSQLAMVNTGDPSGVAAGDAYDGLHPWAQGFGQHADQNARGGVQGYDANTYGGAFGMDTRNLGADNVFGGSFAYGFTRVNSDNANSTDTNVNTYQATLYGNHAFGRTDYFVAGMAAAGYDRNNASRHDVGGIAGLDAHASYDSWQEAGRIEGGRNFRMGEALGGVILTPMVTADYVHYNAESYTETGARGANLHVGSSDENLLNLGIGGRAEWRLRDGTTSLIYKPDIHASYQYDVLRDDHADTSSTFQAGGGTFSTGGLNPSNSTFNVGAGFKLYNAGPWDFSATADYTAKPDYNAYSGMVRAGYKF